jgi:hypothetical protein
LLLVFFSLQSLYSQGSAGKRAEYESRYIVDKPTAGVLKKGSFSGMSLLERNGSIMVELSAAPFTNFNIGMSYSGGNIIGSGDPVWQGIPGFHIRWRLMDETIKYPALTIGANTQGRGTYNDKTKLFSSHSPGLFVSSSKNYVWALGSVAFHAGIGYSFETRPEDRMPNLYIGLEHSIGNRISFNLEYSGDIAGSSSGTTKDYQVFLNSSLRWTIHNGFTLEMQFRDLLERSKETNGFSRALSLEYISFF